MNMTIENLNARRLSLEENSRRCLTTDYLMRVGVPGFSVKKEHFVDHRFVRHTAASMAAKAQVIGGSAADMEAVAGEVFARYGYAAYDHTRTLRRAGWGRRAKLAAVRAGVRHRIRFPRMPAHWSERLAMAGLGVLLLSAVACNALT